MCTDNKVSVEFFPNVFQMKDLNSGPPILTVQSKNGCYEWPSRESTSPFVFASSIKCSLRVWHSRLGHPSILVLKCIVSSSLILHQTLCSFHYSECLINKIHKTPFAFSSFSSSKPLELVFSNVCTSPTHSIDGFKHCDIYCSYTHYIWLYPICCKSHVHNIFIKWKDFVDPSEGNASKYSMVLMYLFN